MSGDSLVKVAEDILLTAANLRENHTGTFIDDYVIDVDEIEGYVSAMIDEAVRIVVLAGIDPGQVWVPEACSKEWESFMREAGA